MTAGAHAHFLQPDMVALPPGYVVIEEHGGADAKPSLAPIGQVRIPYRLEIGRAPVTFAEWDAARADGAGLPELVPFGVEGSDGAVRPVSWDETQIYIDHLNRAHALTGRPDRYRLPTEAEWQYLRQHAVAEEKLEGLGAGVNEWCEAVLREPVKAHPKKPWLGPLAVAPNKRPVWMKDASAHPDWRYQERDSKHFIGFRVARSLPPTGAERACVALAGGQARRFAFDAFLSHNQRDGSIALAKALEQRGVRVWHDGDRDMSNADVQRDVRAALDLSRLICVCVGSQFRDSEWVRAEYNLALRSEQSVGALRVIVIAIAPGARPPAALERKPLLRGYDSLDYLAALLRIANAQADAGAEEWMVLADDGHILRTGAIKLLQHDRPYLDNWKRPYDLELSVAERDKLAARRLTADGSE
jgi:hypothetical protein